MKIIKKIKLNNNYYYLIIDVEYKKHKDGFAVLCLKNFNDDYWDGGNCSLLIEKIEKKYDSEKTRKHHKNIPFISDVIYIYERIPFISGIKEIYMSNDNKSISTESYIDKSEIENYIKDFNIPINNNLDFKLIDERTWKI